VEIEPSFGFTLIEIMVSISIFTAVMMITIGALISLNDGSRKAQALRTVIDNLNFAVEDITRKVRTGSSYHCFSTPAEVSQAMLDAVPTKYNSPKDCSAGGYAISLQTQDVIPTWVIYIYDQTNGVIKIRTKKSPSTVFGPLLNVTSGEVTISDTKFTVRGAMSPYSAVPISRQPIVILNISGTVDLKKEKLRTDFSLQTAISHRELR
ncbi:MAG: prepilin-type N-terminal cleavage/methylation domain-containing protein, partial [Patescibacteria group bacterium]